MIIEHIIAIHLTMKVSSILLFKGLSQFDFSIFCSKMALH